MDITSLPEEMLVKVLKKQDYGTVRNLRKLNKHIDSVARRNNIATRVPVDTFRFHSTGLEPCIQVYIDERVASHLKSQQYFTFKMDLQNKAQCMNKYLARVTICDALYLRGNVQIKDDLLAVMKCNPQSLRYINYIDMHGIGCYVPPNKLRTFFNLCPKANRLKAEIYHEESYQNLCGVQAYDNRKWESIQISFEAHDKPPTIDFQFVLKAIRNSNHFALKKGIRNFSVPEIQAMIQNCFTDDTQKKKIEIETISMSRRQRNELEAYLEEHYKDYQVIIQHKRYMVSSYKNNISRKIEIVVKTS